MSKFYAVREGKVPGIYMSWPACQKQVTGFSGAIFKGFKTRADAEKFLLPIPTEEKYDNVFYTDGSLRGDVSGGAAVDTIKKVVYYGSVGGKDSTNGRGELQGIYLAVKFSEGSLHIFSDSQTYINVFQHGYKAHTNHDLVNEIVRLMKGRSVRFDYVEAHNGDYHNEIADKYAKEGTEGLHGDVMVAEYE